MIEAYFIWMILFANKLKPDVDKAFHMDGKV